MNAYSTDYDAIVKTIQHYIDGMRAGKSDLMRPGFRPDASFIGFAGGTLYDNIQQLFDWIDQNGPAPDAQARFASIDVLESIAVVRLELENFSGKLAGSDVHMSDVFTLLKTDEGWKITQKTFHWHAV
jgi:hypothetical protein